VRQCGHDIDRFTVNRRISCRVFSLQSARPFDTMTSSAAARRLARRGKSRADGRKATPGAGRRLNPCKPQSICFIIYRRISAPR
jgi:hypothetical protein